MSSPGGGRGGDGAEGSPIPIDADSGGRGAITPDPPLALPAPPPSNPRRLPPPCWSHDETVALIDSYRDKWYSLRRGNLKANHWQEVADDVGRRCPGASPPKTAVQCRHKMEKLRKRYRAEIQRARSMPVSRFASSWVHFKRMDSMEKGPQPHLRSETEGPHTAGVGGGGDENDDVDEDDLSTNFINNTHHYYPPSHSFNSNPNYNHNTNNIHQGGSFPTSNGVFYTTTSARGVPHKLYNNSNSAAAIARNGLDVSPPPPLSASATGGGFRIRIPTGGGGGVSIAQPAPTPTPPPSHKFYTKVNLPTPASGFNQPNSTRVARGGGGGGAAEDLGKKRDRNDPMEEMVAAVKLLGDGFVRMEQMKMEMAREMETMRMEMEMKRTEMILDSQHRIIEAFAKAFSDKKRKKMMQQQQEELPKRVPSPPES